MLTTDQIVELENSLSLIVKIFVIVMVPWLWQYWSGVKLSGFIVPFYGRDVRLIYYFSNSIELQIRVMFP